MYGLSGPRESVAMCGWQYDTNEIGVWSNWQGGLDPLVMVVGQDWGDVASFERQKGIETASATNKILCELLASAGLESQLPSGRTQRGDLFFTNAILCLKPGGIQDKLSPKWVTNCRERFLRPQIEIIQPGLVVCLGEWAYKGVVSAYGLRTDRFREAVERAEPLVLPGGTRVLAVYHCGRRILNTHRFLEAQRRDWQRVGAVVRKLRSEYTGDA